MLAFRSPSPDIRYIYKIQLNKILIISTITIASSNKIAHLNNVMRGTFSWYRTLLEIQSKLKL